MGKRITTILLAFLAACCVLVGVGFLGAFAGWWALGTTEMGPIPDDSGGVFVSQPSREGFSSEKAWDEYQANWRDPYWDGEHPEGYRYKVASFVNGERAGYRPNQFIAGCVSWTFEDAATDEEAAELAKAVKAEEYYLLPREGLRDANGQAFAWQVLLLYFDEEADIWAKRKAVESIANASSRDFHGSAGIVSPTDAALPSLADGS